MTFPKNSEKMLKILYASNMNAMMNGKDDSNSKTNNN